MEKNRASPAAYLRSEFAKRADRNSSYSTRAFARDLGMSVSFLSEILSEKKKLPLKRALEIVDDLKLAEKEQNHFLSMVLVSSSDQRLKPWLSARLEAEESHGESDFTNIDRLEFLSRWYHIAILELSETKGYRPDADWIANRLDLKKVQVDDAVQRLKRLGLFSEKGWKKTSKRFRVDSKPSRELREHQAEMIEKALDLLKHSSDRDFDTRDFSSATLSVNPKKISEVKKRIQKFRRKLIQDFGAIDAQEVYQLNLQFFPLSKGMKR